MNQCAPLLSEEFRVNRRRLADFSAVFGAPDDPHLSGSLAEPIFAHVPVMQSMVEVVQALGAGFVVHGEHDFLFHQPIRPGQRLMTETSLDGIRGSPPGRLLMIRSVSRDSNGAPVCTQITTCLEVGVPHTGPEADPPERPDFGRVAPSGDPVARIAVTPDIAARYAEAARDYAPYTLDQAAAEAVRFTAPVLHGMCTLGLACREIIDRMCGGDPARLRRLGCRFGAPVYMIAGQELQLFLDGTDIIGFNATDTGGALILRNGYAEITL